ncbi:MAG: FtsX-like permease family protein, partial [Bacteroidota bacterium]
PEEAIGVEINQWGDKLTVKGVFKDYFHRSLKNNPLPTLYRYYPYVGDYQSFKVETAALDQVIPKMQESFERTFPGNPFEYFFADEQYGQLYKAEQTSGKIFSLFSLLAVAVACLGLFGLISYALVRRTKEIGIRKVLGATYQHILGLLLKDFLFLVIFAGLIAIPFTWWAISSWLEEYPQRIGIQIDLFILPVIVVMGLALLTILRSTIISAQAKPVDSLRVD